MENNFTKLRAELFEGLIKNTLKRQFFHVDVRIGIKSYSPLSYLIFHDFVI